MKLNLNYIITASKQVLTRKNYFIAFIVLIFIILSVFVAIPVFLVPSNSLSFQLTIFTIKDYILLGILSVLTSLVIVMRVFSYTQAKLYSKLSPSGKSMIGGGSISGLSAIIAAVFGTATCTSCIATVFGFLGIGTVLFLAKYRWLVVGVTILIMLVSLYLSSLKVNGVCESCKR